MAIHASMHAPTPSAEVADAGIPGNLVEVGVYRDAKGAFDHGLVVLAQGYPCWIVPLAGNHQLLVEAGAAVTVRGQLACFDRESIGWPPAVPVEPARPSEIEVVTPGLWVLAVVATFWAQGEWSGLTTAGALDAQAVFTRGEAWRAFTALFLHADFAHLVANALGGLFIFSAVLSTLGRRRGWLLLAAASVAGNLAAAALNFPGPYRSIGASTAIFAGLGLLTGRQVRVAARAERPRRWRAMLVPFAAGLAVLGLYGTGGLRTDLVAHAAGFVAGLVLGGSLGATRQSPPKRDKAVES